MKNTADVTGGGKPSAGAVLLQSISGVSAIIPLVAFYDIHVGNRWCYSFILSWTPTRDKKIYENSLFAVLVTIALK
jgi:hypothetical protein